MLLFVPWVSLVTPCLHTMQAHAHAQFCTLLSPLVPFGCRMAVSMTTTVNTAFGSKVVSHSTGNSQMCFPLVWAYQYEASVQQMCNAGTLLKGQFPYLPTNFAKLACLCASMQASCSTTKWMISPLPGDPTSMEYHQALQISLGERGRVGTTFLKYGICCVLWVVPGTWHGSTSCRIEGLAPITRNCNIKLVAGLERNLLAA